MKCALELEEGQYMDILKVSVVGPGGVGKTTIANLISGKRVTKRYDPTIGINFATASLREIDATISIFDFAGQDRFGFMIEDLIRGSKITLLVTDSTPKNVLSAKRMLKWLKKLKGGRIFGIANKQDIEGVLSPDRVEKMLGVKTYGMIAIDSRKKVHMYRILLKALQETL